MIAVGPGATDKHGKVLPMAVKAGDRVLLPGWGGNAIKVGEDVRSPAFLRVSCPLTLYLALCRSTIFSGTQRFSQRSRSKHRRCAER